MAGHCWETEWSGPPGPPEVSTQGPREGPLHMAKRLWLSPDRVLWGVAKVCGGPGLAGHPSELPNLSADPGFQSSYS